MIYYFYVYTARHRQIGILPLLKVIKKWITDIPNIDVQLFYSGIAVAGEEAKNPAKSIPVATCLAMTIVTLLYMGNCPFPHKYYPI